MKGALARPIRLSKSKLMAGIQCPKRLYLTLKHPDLADAVSASQQAVFDQGHEVGVAAQKRYPDGKLIDAPYTAPAQALADTEQAVQAGALVLYEAAFLHDDVLVRVDILHRAKSSDPWHIVEVKSTTQAKEQHIQDAAIQAWVLRGAGLKVRSVSVLHLNNQFVYPNQGELFAQADVSDQIDKTIDQIPVLLKNLRTQLAAPEAPATDIGPHCADPYDCEFQTHCWAAKEVPPLSIFDIPGLASKRKWQFYSAGVTKLTDKNLAREKFNPTQLKMIEVSTTGRRQTNPKAIAAELRKWTYPFYFLDFETINPALPRYPGTRPFQQLPFQFSCHIQLKPGGPLIHQEYLHNSDTDPRASIAQALVDSIGQDGSVVAYNKAFEGVCLTDLAESFPKHAKALLSIKARLVDPLPIVRAHVYDSAFHGSFSIKYVAPALLGASMSYEGMAVSNGTEAQVGYMNMISPKTNPEQMINLRRDMLAYCRQDTLAMVNLVEWLRVHSSSVSPEAGNLE